MATGQGWEEGIPIGQGKLHETSEARGSMQRGRAEAGSAEVMRPGVNTRECVLYAHKAPEKKYHRGTWTRGAGVSSGRIPFGTPLLSQVGTNSPQRIKSRVDQRTPPFLVDVSAGDCLLLAAAWCLCARGYVRGWVGVCLRVSLADSSRHRLAKQIRLGTWAVLVTGAAGQARPTTSIHACRSSGVRIAN